MKRGLWLLVLIPVLLYGVYLGAIYGMQQDILYPGRRYPVPQIPERQIPGMQVVWLQTSQGKVEVWYLPPEHRIAERGPAIIFAHGNGELIEHWRDSFDPLRQRGLAVMLVEYPGYGRSEGEPQERLIRETFVKAYDTLAAMPEVDPKAIVAYGQSLGGGAVSALAAERPVRALILQSTFTSLRPFARKYFAPPTLLRDTYDSLAVVRRYAGPVLVIHGSHDAFIPASEGRALASAAHHGTYREYSCGHTCWDVATLPLWEDIQDFLTASQVIPSVGTSNTLSR